MYFIDKKMCSSVGDMHLRSILNGMCLEPEVVKGNIQCLFIGAEGLFDMLQNHGRLSGPARAFYGNQAVIPIDGFGYRPDKVC